MTVVGYLELRSVYANNGHHGEVSDQVFFRLVRAADGGGDSAAAGNRGRRPGGGEDRRIAVFPTATYYIYIVYESLAVFWVAILGLLVIIRMKLREIERVQALGADKEDPDAPLLE